MQKSKKTGSFYDNLSQASEGGKVDTATKQCEQDFTLMTLDHSKSFESSGHTKEWLKVSLSASSRTLQITMS